MIRLLLLDVDGTLTDGHIYFVSCAQGADVRMCEGKGFHVHDGLALSAWMKLGREVAIISGRESHALRTRASELGIRRLFLGNNDKKPIAISIISELGLAREEVACIGDDVNDLGLFAVSGRCFAPADANPYIQQQAHIVLTRRGGEGAVREMIDNILQQDGDYEAFLSLYAHAMQ